jgi:ADP-heptose:LPS heptosyltransferase
MMRHLHLLAIFQGWLTVLDAFGAPGDTLLAAIVCRTVKQLYPGIRINLVTNWPNLVQYDPSLDAVNAPETYFTLRFWYLETVARKEFEKNVLDETLSTVGISKYDYNARVYLTDDERRFATQLLSSSGSSTLPRLAFCTRSKEMVKNWPKDRWEELLEQIRNDWQLIQLGDDSEPIFPCAIRFAGNLTMRESMSVLEHCQMFVGPDSFLMHAANGLDVPSVILFGGSRPSACLGYSKNINLYVSMPCGPCWLHDSRGDVCDHSIMCMDQILIADVIEGINRQKQVAALR